MRDTKRFYWISRMEEEEEEKVLMTRWKSEIIKDKIEYRIRDKVIDTQTKERTVDRFSLF